MLNEPDETKRRVDNRRVTTCLKKELLKPEIPKTKEPLRYSVFNSTLRRKSQKDI